MAFTEPDYQLPVEPIPGGVTLGLSKASSLSKIARVARVITQLVAERKSIAKALGLLTDVDHEQHAQDVIIRGLDGRELTAFNNWRQGCALPTLRVDPQHPSVMPTNPSKLTLLEDYRRVLMDLYDEKSVTLQEAANWRAAYPDVSPLVAVFLRGGRELTPTQLLEYRAAKAARTRIASLKQDTYRQLQKPGSVEASADRYPWPRRRRRQLQDCEEAERFLSGIVEQLGARLSGRRVRHLPPAQPISAARGPTNMHLEHPVHINLALAAQVAGRLPRVPTPPVVSIIPAQSAPSQAPTCTPALGVASAPRPVDDMDGPSPIRGSGKRERSLSPEPGAPVDGPSPIRRSGKRVRSLSPEPGAPVDIARADRAPSPSHVNVTITERLSGPPASRTRSRSRSRKRH